MDGQTDAGQSDPYVSLCFAGDTKIMPVLKIVAGRSTAQIVGLQLKWGVRFSGVPEEYHAHSGDSSWGGTAQVMGLEQEVDIGTKLDSLTRGHG